MPRIGSQIKIGETMQVGKYRLTPVTRVLKVQIPGYHAGLIWNRPKAVMVRTVDGQEQVLPVTDITRILIWAMLTGGLLGAILTGILYRSK